MSTEDELDVVEPARRASVPAAPEPTTLPLNSSNATAISLTKQPPELPGLVSKFRDLGEELEAGVPEPEWVGLAGLVSRGAITTLGGYIGAGKTPLTLRAIRAILTGNSFLDFPAAPVPDGFKVVYLTQEAAPTFLPAAAEAGLTQDVARGRFMVGYFHDFATAKWNDAVGAAVRVLDGNGLLVVDTSADWSQTSDENDNAQMTLAYRPLQIAVGTGISVWTNAHTVKTFDNVGDDDATHAGIRGAGAIVASSSLIFTYKMAKPRREGGVRHLKRQRSRLATDGLPTEQHVILEDGALRTLHFLEDAMRMSDAGTSKLHAIVKEAGGRILKSKARDKAKLNGTNLASALAGLEGIVAQTGAGKSGDPYYLQLVDHGEAG